jgi:UDP-N-acetylmuramate--alanine ligase
VIYTPAIPKAHKEMNWFREHGYQLMKRSQALGVITDTMPLLGVAGTHGKTTITSMCTHMAIHAGLNTAAFVGGIVKNYGTNLILPEEGKEVDICVAEADEFDRSFLFLHPRYAVISNIDDEHMEIFSDNTDLTGGFEAYAANMEEGGTLALHTSVDMRVPGHVKLVRYHMDDGDADYYAKNTAGKEGFYRFDIQTPGGEIKDVALGVPGRLNIENALAATALLQAAGLSDGQIKAGLESFRGVKRRQDILYRDERMVFIDDYAHHPGEIGPLLRTLREWFPGRKITGIFQPKLFTRTRDFMDDFVRELDQLDSIIALDIYPAREEPIPGITTSVLLDKMKIEDKVLLTYDELIDYLRGREFDVLVVIGSGDIDMLSEPIADMLKEKYKK